ncbi:MAG: HAD-IA family hydrolase [Paracoccus sp. (in: a-proteobacteria)]|nr:HAD-IA family hydrolase [Paracoccus sp. (in: a-proteobacteria)]
MKLIVFDVDGTLVDSQNLINAAMASAFEGAGLAPLPMSTVLSIVGLSLPQAIARLAPGADATTQARIVEGYKESFMGARKSDPAPLYPGARDCLDRLRPREDALLGIATGKSRRGLDAMLAHHDLARHFVTAQVADDHPSKPHPSMLYRALAETGARQAVMIGDTVFDIEMAANAGVPAIGVSWGYHPAEALAAAGAMAVVEDYAALSAALEEWL